MNCFNDIKTNRIFTCEICLIASVYMNECRIYGNANVEIRHFCTEKKYLPSSQFISIYLSDYICLYPPPSLSVCLYLIYLSMNRAIYLSDSVYIRPCLFVCLSVLSIYLSHYFFISLTPCLFISHPLYPFLFITIYLPIPYIPPCLFISHPFSFSVYIYLSVNPVMIISLPLSIYLFQSVYIHPSIYKHKKIVGKLKTMIENHKICGSLKYLPKKNVLQFFRIYKQNLSKTVTNGCSLLFIKSDYLRHSS